MQAFSQNRRAQLTEDVRLCSRTLCRGTSHVAPATIDMTRHGRAQRRPAQGSDDSCKRTSVPAPWAERGEGNEQHTLTHQARAETSVREVVVEAVGRDVAELLAAALGLAGWCRRGHSDAWGSDC